MSDREAAIFVIISDKDQTINKAILKVKSRIIDILKFERHIEELEIDDTADDYFDKIFLSYEQYYSVYTSTPEKFTHEKRINLVKGELIIAIFSVNSAGYWEQLQIIPANSGISNIKYYTKRETIFMPS